MPCGGLTVWLRLEEGLSPGRVRVEAAGAWGAPCCAHRSKCPSLWSAERKCAVSCGVLQGRWWPLIFHPALSLKERKPGGWGCPQGSEDTNSHSVGKWKSHTEKWSWLLPGDSGLGDSAPHPPLTHLMRKEKQSQARVTITPTKPWKCLPHPPPTLPAPSPIP